MPVRVVRVGLAHHDQDFTIITHGAGGKPLTPVDNVVITLSSYGTGDIGCIRGGDVRFGHGKTGAYLTCQQGF